MTTKTITGAYSGGYALNTSYSTLNIAATASVGGNGVTAAGSSPSTISNLGSLTSGTKLNNNNYAYYLSALDLSAGGRVTNGSAQAQSVVLKGGGIEIGGAPGTVVNFATVTTGLNINGYHNENYNAAVDLKDGGMVVNGSSTDTSAVLFNGVMVSGGAATVVNFGTIKDSGTAGYDKVGVTLSEGGKITNGSASDLGAYIQRVALTGPAAITNFGTIGSLTVLTASDVTVSNTGSLGSVRGANRLVNHGSIIDTTSNSAGVVIRTGGTVVNFGTISETGENSKALYFASGPGTLIEEGSGLLVGTVVGGGGTLELAADAGTGTIAGLGGEISGFKTIKVEAGAGWHLAGPNAISTGDTFTSASGVSIADTLTNDGVISAGAVVAIESNSELDNAAGGRFVLRDNASITPAAGATATTVVNAGLLVGESPLSVVRVDIDNTGVIEAYTGTLRVTGAVTGTGIVRIANGVADITGLFTEHVTFLAGSTGTLELAQSRNYTGTVSGLSTTGANALDLNDIAYVDGTTKAAYSGTASSGVLTVTSGAHVAKIKLLGDYLGSTWNLSADSSGGTIVRDPKPTNATAITASPSSATTVASFVQASASFGGVASSGHLDPSLKAAAPVSLLAHPHFTVA